MWRLNPVNKLTAEEIFAVRVYVYISGPQSHQYVCHMYAVALGGVLPRDTAHMRRKPRVDVCELACARM